MKILTITLNPAFDMHCNIEKLQLYKENYVTSFVKHAGGKGINVSRALTGFDVENIAVCILGDSGGQEFLRLLQEDSIHCNHIMTEGRIRENITIHSCDKETRISFEGFEINKVIIDDLYEMVKSQQCDDFVVTFTGRLCKGISNAEAVEFLKKIKSLGAKLIVDCNSFTIEEITEISPYLIKPNEQEISQLLGYEVEKEDEAFVAAQKLCNLGIENVIVSLGSKGSVFCSQNSKLRIKVPEIVPVSTIGAGDSLIAGFVAGISSSRDITDTLKLAAAFGTAACLTQGTNPPRKSDIFDIKEKIMIERG